MTPLNFNRQEALWGNQGQNILHDSSVAVFGLDNLGAEVVKALVTLGVRNLYVFDNTRNKAGEFFLDIPLKRGRSKSQTIEEVVKKCFDKDCNIVPFHSLPNKTFTIMYPIDAIVDCTNNESSQLIGLDLAEKTGIGLFTACADIEKGEIAFFDRKNENNCNPIIEGYRDQQQGVIISNLLCGIVVEEIRKYLFKKFIDKFTIPILRETVGQSFEEHDYRKTIERDRMLKRNFYHDISGLIIKQRNGIEKNKSIKTRHELYLPYRKILVLGGGALGTDCAIMLSAINKSLVDFVDFDRYADHNIIRQHLAYNRLNRFKSEVLSEKIKIMNSSITSEGIIGIVGEEKDSQVLEEAMLAPENVILVDEEWIANRRYDLILGCFDNMKARRYASDVAFRLKIPYIDGGSDAEPTRASVNIFDPNTDKESLSRIFSGNDNEAELRNRRWADFRASQRGQELETQQYFIQGQGCDDFVAGSVSMGNQIASALMIAEARRFLNPKLYKGEIVKKANYRSDVSYRLRGSNS